MRKKSLFLVLALVLCAPWPQWCSRASAQNDEAREGESRPAFDFAVNLSIGLSSYEDSTGRRLAFQYFGVFPEFAYGRWKLGFDLSFELDGDFHPRDLDNDGHPDRWTTLHDYVTRIHHLSYGREGDPVHGRVGAFQTRTLGHGLVMDRYSDAVFYPQVIQLGLDLDVDGAGFSFPYVGFEAVVDDVLDWDVVGGRLYVRPLAGKANPLLKRLEFGGVFVTDMDPQENPADSPKDNPASESVSVYGADVELPLFEKERTSFVAYADWAKIADGGSGALVGGTFTRGWLALLAQLRLSGREFVPSYFDSFYERDRSVKRAALAAYDRFTVGYLLGTEMNVRDAASFSFRWADGIGDPEGPRVLVEVGKTEKYLPRVDFSLSYDKRDIDGFSDFFSKDDSLMRLKVGYRLGSAAGIAFTFEKAFSPYLLTPANRTYVETRFSF